DCSARRCRSTSCSARANAMSEGLSDRSDRANAGTAIRMCRHAAHSERNAGQEEDHASRHLPGDHAPQTHVKQPGRALGIHARRPPCGERDEEGHEEPDADAQPERDRSWMCGATATTPGAIAPVKLAIIPAAWRSPRTGRNVATTWMIIRTRATTRT